MLKRILTIGSTIFHPSEKLYKIGIESLNSCFKGCCLAGLADGIVHLALRLVDHLLYPGRMNTSVHDEPFQCDTSYLTPHRVEGRKHYCLRRIVYDDLHAGKIFEGSDVPSLAAYDTPLHIVAGKLYHRNGSLCDMIRGTSLYRRYDDILCLLVGFFLGMRQSFLDKSR